MGKTIVDGRPVVTPASEMRVSDLKELANVAPSEKLYTPAGQVLRDEEVVRTDDARFGVAPDFERGEA